MTLKLTYKAETSLPVEIAGLTPTWAKGKSLDDISQFKVLHGNHKRALAELFDTAGSTSDMHIELHGNLSGVHWIGAQLSEGKIQVHGPAGRHLGSEMTGGCIEVYGDAQDWVGAEMRGGLIRVRGNAGHLAGAAYRGSNSGMTGGTIIVDGNAGDEVGLAMRRGMIAVGGNAGNMLGFNMLAGTALVFGECGSHPGAGMRRGTLGMLGSKRPHLLPTYSYACATHPQVLSVIFNDLRSQGFSINQALLTTDYEVYNGDMVSLGRGEILVPRQFGT